MLRPPRSGTHVQSEPGGLLPPRRRVVDVEVRRLRMLARQPQHAHQAAPAQGEHSAEILRETGFSDAEIATLSADGTIVGDVSTD